jgi:hypothetical protein
MCLKALKRGYIYAVYVLIYAVYVLIYAVMCLKALKRGWSRLPMAYEEEDTCMSHEEEDKCMSYEEEDTCMSYEEEDTYLVKAPRLSSLLVFPLHVTLKGLSRALRFHKLYI